MVGRTSSIRGVVSESGPSTAIEAYEANLGRGL